MAYFIPGSPFQWVSQIAYRLHQNVAPTTDLEIRLSFSSL